MLNSVHIRGFKSVWDLRFRCRKINLFIGEPNTGKSNILEALAMFSFAAFSNASTEKGDFVRYERPGHLFYDENLSEPVEIRLNNVAGLSLIYQFGQFQGSLFNTQGKETALLGDHDILSRSERDLRTTHALATSFKFYRFRVLNEFPEQVSEFLLPPVGRNLLHLLISNTELRHAMNLPFSPLGLRLGLRPQENKIEVVKSAEDIVISYPYSLTSDTIQRVNFYMAGLLSNKDSVIILEEPESHSFPFHTKYLAEQIAQDENRNQFFIATHNPYFLLPVLEKVKKEDVAIHIVYYEDYQTKIKELRQEHFPELADIDVFLNLERYLEDD